MLHVHDSETRHLQGAYKLMLYVYDSETQARSGPRLTSIWFAFPWYSLKNFGRTRWAGVKTEISTMSEP
jgi:hypothetical protein